MEMWQGIDYDAVASFCIFTLYWRFIIIVLLGRNTTWGKFEWRH